MLGADYPERVKRLVTLDGLDNAWGGWADIPQPPTAPDPTSEDLLSLQHLAAYLHRLVVALFNLDDHFDFIVQEYRDIDLTPIPMAAPTDGRERQLRIGHGTECR